MKRSLYVVAAGLLLSTHAFAGWDPVCGFADPMQARLRANTSDPVKSQTMLAGKQGETARRVLFFASGNWIVTFEFFSDGPVEKDVSCLITSGVPGDEAAIDWVTRKISKLPTATFGDFGKDPSDFEPLKKFVPADDAP